MRAPIVLIGIGEVDFNHPLAGHTLIFELEVLDVIAPIPGSEDATIASP